MLVGGGQGRPVVAARPRRPPACSPSAHQARGQACGREQHTGCVVGQRPAPHTPSNQHAHTTYTRGRQVPSCRRIVVLMSLGSACLKGTTATAARQNLKPHSTHTHTHTPAHLQVVWRWARLLWGVATSFAPGGPPAPGPPYRPPVSVSMRGWHARESWFGAHKPATASAPATTTTTCQPQAWGGRTACAGRAASRMTGGQQGQVTAGQAACRTQKANGRTGQQEGKACQGHSLQKTRGSPLPCMHRGACATASVTCDMQPPGSALNTQA